MDFSIDMSGHIGRSDKHTNHDEPERDYQEQHEYQEKPQQAAQHAANASAAAAEPLTGAAPPREPIMVRVKLSDKMLSDGYLLLHPSFPLDTGLLAGPAPASLPLTLTPLAAQPLPATLHWIPRPRPRPVTAQSQPVAGPVAPTANDMLCRLYGLGGWLSGQAVRQGDVVVVSFISPNHFSLAAEAAAPLPELLAMAQAAAARASEGAGGGGSPQKQECAAVEQQPGGVKRPIECGRGAEGTVQRVRQKVSHPPKMSMQVACTTAGGDGAGSEAVRGVNGLVQDRRLTRSLTAALQSQEASPVLMQQAAPEVVPQLGLSESSLAGDGGSGGAGSQVGERHHPPPSPCNRQPSPSNREVGLAELLYRAGGGQPDAAEGVQQAGPPGGDAGRGAAVLGGVAAQDAADVIGTEVMVWSGARSGRLGSADAASSGNLAALMADTQVAQDMAVDPPVMPPSSAAEWWGLEVQATSHVADTDMQAATGQDDIEAMSPVMVRANHNEESTAEQVINTAVPELYCLTPTAAEVTLNTAESTHLEYDGASSPRTPGPLVTEVQQHQAAHVVQPPQPSPPRKTRGTKAPPTPWQPRYLTRSYLQALGLHGVIDFEEADIVNVRRAPSPVRPLALSATGALEAAEAGSGAGPSQSSPTESQQQQGQLLQQGQQQQGQLQQGQLLQQGQGPQQQGQLQQGQLLQQGQGPQQQGQLLQMLQQVQQGQLQQGQLLQGQLLQMLLLLHTVVVRALSADQARTIVLTCRCRVLVRRRGPGAQTDRADALVEELRKNISAGDTALQVLQGEDYYMIVPSVHTLLSWMQQYVKLIHSSVGRSEQQGPDSRGLGAATHSQPVATESGRSKGVRRPP